MIFKYFYIDYLVLRQICENTPLFQYSCIIFNLLSNYIVITSDIRGIDFRTMEVYLSLEVKPRSQFFLYITMLYRINYFKLFISRV